MNDPNQVPAAGAPAQRTMTIGNDASVFVSELQVTGQALLFAMDAQSYGQSAFLDRRIRRPQPDVTATIAWSQLHGFAAQCQSQDTRWIFHISHVGSTLLSRALGVHSRVLALREPMLLRTLARQCASLHLAESTIDVPTWERDLTIALGLLGRPLGIRDQVVIKATSYCNVMAREIMALQPASRAVAIYCALDNFLAGILKGRGGLLDILEMAPLRLRRLHRLIGAQTWSLAAMSPAEQAAMSWTCELLSLWEAQRFHPARFSWLNFDRWAGREHSMMQDLAAKLSISWSDKDAMVLEQEKILGNYSKYGGRPFTAQDRLTEIADVKAREASNIRKGLEWFEDCCNKHPAIGRAISEILASDPP